VTQCPVDVSQRADLSGFPDLISLYEWYGTNVKRTIIWTTRLNIATLSDCAGVMPMINPLKTATASLIPRPDGWYRCMVADDGRYSR
jgi:hypothetical protein